MRPSSPAFTSNRRIPDLRSKNTKAVGRTDSIFAAAKAGSGECSRGLFARLTSSPSRQCTLARKIVLLCGFLPAKHIDCERIATLPFSSTPNRHSQRPAQSRSHCPSRTLWPRHFVKIELHTDPAIPIRSASAQRERRAPCKATALAARRSPAPASRPANRATCLY